MIRYIFGSLFISVILFSISAQSCGTTPPIPPTPIYDAAPADIYTAACSNLAALGCPEGKASSCVITMRKAQEANLTDLKPSCLAAAKTVEAAQACGSVTCIVSQ